jgi:hypothetical protein
LNTEPPYEIGPKDVDKDMLLANIAPSYDQLSALIAEGKAILLHDPEWFDQDQVAKAAELDTQALIRMGKLKAPVLVYHRDVVDVFDRLYKDACANHWETFKQAVQKDNPDFDFTDKARVALVARTVVSGSVLTNAASKLHMFSAHFMSLRLKHGVDPGVHSAVTAIPDIRDDGQGVMSLISMHGVESAAGDERLYIDLYRPN